MSDWTDEYEDISPPCPACGDEITDTPAEDFDPTGYMLIECAGCGSMVMVSGRTVSHYKARLESVAGDDV